MRSTVITCDVCKEVIKNKKDAVYVRRWYGAVESIGPITVGINADYCVDHEICKSCDEKIKAILGK